MPKIGGFEKVKILGSVMKKQLVKRLVTGEVIVTDIKIEAPNKRETTASDADVNHQSEDLDTV